MDYRRLANPFGSNGPVSNPAAVAAGPKVLANLGDVNGEYGSFLVLRDPDGSVAVEQWDEKQGRKYEVSRFDVEDDAMKDLDWADWKAIAKTHGISYHELEFMALSQDPVQRAAAYQMAAQYHGYVNLDQYPLHLTTREMTVRYPDLF